MAASLFLYLSATNTFPFKRKEFGTCWQNGILTKWRVDKMAGWQNGGLTKWQVDKMVGWQNGALIKCQIDKMVDWQNGRLTKWQVDKMADWQNGGWTKWPFGDYFNSCVVSSFKVFFINKTKFLSPASIQRSRDKICFIH